MSDLKAEVAARFVAVNGEHPMGAVDDAYVDRHFVPLERLSERCSVAPDVVRRHMLARRLPLPGYLKSDGTEMVPSDLLDLAERAGGIGKLPGWFAAHWTDTVEAAAEWDGYLSGQNVCLRSVTPDTLQRKSYLVSAISQALAEPEESDWWLEELHRLVDELEKLELPFTGYDRLRFGGPVTRDVLIDAVRVKFPRP